MIHVVYVWHAMSFLKMTWINSWAYDFICLKKNSMKSRNLTGYGRKKQNIVTQPHWFSRTSRTWRKTSSRRITLGQTRDTGDFELKDNGGGPGVQMFGLLVSGRLVDTAFRQVDQTHFVIDVHQPDAFNHVVVRKLLNQNHLWHRLSSEFHARQCVNYPKFIAFSMY